MGLKIRHLIRRCFPGICGLVSYPHSGLQVSLDGRKSGDWTNVRLYFHDTGPDVAVYTFAEAKSWTAIETGNAKMVEAIGHHEHAVPVGRQPAGRGPGGVAGRVLEQG